MSLTKQLVEWKRGGYNGARETKLIMLKKNILIKWRVKVMSISMGQGKSCISSIKETNEWSPTING